MALRPVRRTLEGRATDLDAGSDDPARELPERPVPEQGSQGSPDELSQRLLLPLLRYAIDKRSIRAVKILFDENPRGVRARFIVHNLGKARADWLREKGLIDG